MLVAEPQLDPALRDTPLLIPRAIADMAVAALRAEAQLTPSRGWWTDGVAACTPT